MAPVGRGFRAEFFAACFIAFAVFFAGRSSAAEDTLFVSKRITPQGEYTSGIEGPAVDASGTLYVVNFQQGGNIGKLAAGEAQWRLFTSLPAGSIGNGIGFIGRGGCTSPINRSTLSGSSHQAKPRRTSTFIPIGSTSQTTSRSQQTARSMPATRDLHRPPAARSGALRAAPTARVRVK